MNIIKLDAIDSTNSYIKKLSNEIAIESYTVVVANHQTKGRGQLGTSWLSKKGKNLTFSVLIKFKDFKVQNQFYLSMAVSLGILASIKNGISSPLKIKWPNDILSVNNKVAGILIENILRGNFIKQSVIGVGLNVHQKIFPENIENVTSLKNISGNNYDMDALLRHLIKMIKFYIRYIEKKEFKTLKNLYINSLYNYNKPTMFKDKKGKVFLGKIIDISESGRLVVELENKKTCKFNLKEIKFASN
ncbi:biotin--[acetyl-CoA-carboxylase] ligase [Lutibacter sp.]